jgi:Ni/Fe-hydrogenase subunit HybB-like protein
MKKVYPFIIGLAYILPIMHQSSLGALMILAGNRVNTLWQTPFLPLIYVWAAAFLGYNCVVLCVLLAKLAWKRDVDPGVLAELNKLTVWVVYSWATFQLLDILVRGKIFHLFTDGYYSILYWVETALIVGSAYVLSTAKGKKLGTMFLSHACCALGGMIYRFAPSRLLSNSSSRWPLLPLGSWSISSRSRNWRFCRAPIRIGSRWRSTKSRVNPESS